MDDGQCQLSHRVLRRFVIFMKRNGFPAISEP